MCDTVTIAAMAVTTTTKAANSRLLRAAVAREGGQSAFAKRHGVDRVLVKEP